MLTLFTHKRLAVALVVVLAPALPGAPIPEKASAPGPAERLRKDLDQLITMEITEQTLDAAVNLLRDQTKINFVLDRLTLAQYGMEPSQLQLTNAKFKDAKVRAALRTLLAPNNLNFAIVGDAVLITTDDMAVYRQMKQRVSLDVDRLELASALKNLARDTGANVLLDPRIAKEGQTAVTLHLDDVPLETAVRLLAEMAGLKPVRLGNVLFVTGKANAADLRNDPELAPQPKPPVPNLEGGPAMGGAVIVPALPPGALPPPASAPPKPDSR